MSNPFKLNGSLGGAGLHRADGFGTHFMYRARIGRLDTNFGGEMLRAEGGEPQKLGTNSLKFQLTPKWAGPAWQDFCTWARFGTHFIYRVRIGKLDPNFGGEGPRVEGYPP